MSLTVIKSPLIYDFSRNPNYVQIETDNLTYSVNTGDKSVCYFSGLAAAVINDTLAIQVDVTVFTFTFKAATNIGSNEIEVNSGLSTVSYITLLANILNTHVALSALVKVTSYQSSLFFESKLPGPLYNLIYSVTNVAGHGFYTTPGTNNIISVQRPNYKINLDLQVYDGSWKNVVSISKEPSNDQIRADLKDYIDGSLKYNMPDFFDIGSSFACTSVCKKFRVKVSESYGTPPVDVSTALSGMSTSGLDGYKHISNEYKVLKAGFDTISQRIIGDTQFAYYQANQLFLTRQPRVKLTSRKLQPEWLYYIFHAAPASNVCIRNKVYKNDGTITTSYDNHTASGIQIHDVWAFSVFYNDFYLHPEIIKKEVCVWDITTAAAISETFTFLGDNKYPMEETLLYFTNSDGGVDTLRCVGVNECNIDFVSEEASRTLTVDDTHFDGDVENISTEKNNRFSVFSGWRTQEDLNYIEELLMTKKVFTFGNIYGQQIEIPLMITTKQLMRNRTNMNLKGFVIDYKEAVSSPISQANYIPIV